ncbi:MAG: adenylate/guanylate cyclase domain-containing protein [Spirochaetota bacterium]
MFSDIEDFTPKSERLGPEALTLALNSYFEAMARIVAKHHGTLDKFIGDSVMVFFGDPESLGLRQDAVACVAMALEMQAQIPLVVSEWKRLGIEETLDIRIGMSTGPCTVGNFGSSSQLTYTIFGKTVNLASRLESSGSPGKVVVSARTWELVSADFAGQALAPLSLKGMAQPTVAYEILGIRG